MLVAVRDYLRRRGQATLADVAHHFRLSPEVARQMLQVWERKGMVRRRAATAACGTACSQCDPASVEVWEWREDPGAPPPLPPDCRGR